MIIRKYFFDNIRYYLFKSLTQQQVDGCNRYLDWYDGLNPDFSNPPIPDKYHIDDRQFSYILATVYHETAATMTPVKEYGSESYLKSKPYYPWYGRGDVQLTWKENYQKQDNKLQLEGRLMADPDLALHPPLSLQICILGMIDGDFTGKKLSDYFTDTLTDWYNARRIVNGLDQASLIAGYGELFCNAITRD